MPAFAAAGVFQHVLCQPFQAVVFRLQAVGVDGAQRFPAAAGAPQIFQRITQCGAVGGGQAVHLQHHVVVVSHFFQAVGRVGFLVFRHAHPLDGCCILPVFPGQPSAYPFQVVVYVLPGGFIVIRQPHVFVGQGQRKTALVKVGVQQLYQQPRRSFPVTLLLGQAAGKLLLAAGACPVFPLSDPAKIYLGIAITADCFLLSDVLLSGSFHAVHFFSFFWGRMDLEITPIQAAQTAPPRTVWRQPFTAAQPRAIIISKLCPVLRKPPPWFKGCGFGSRLGFFCRAAHQAVVNDCSFCFNNASLDRG